MKKLLAMGLLLLLSGLLPAQLSVSVSPVNISCYSACNGSATATATGGTAPYNFIWMPGSVTGATYSNLCAGTYTVTVTDAALATAQTTVVITQPLQLAGAITPASPMVCIGGTVNFASNITGGTAPYSNQWTLPGGSPSSSVQFNPSVTYSTAGSYTATLTVTDANACTATYSVTVNVSASSVGGTVAGSTNACTGNNSGTLTLSGHTGSIVRWEMSTDGGVTWINIANTTTTQTYTNLSLTTIYRALVQSAGCPSAYSSNATITVPPPPVLSTSETPATCNQSNGVVYASGAMVYVWQPGNLTTASVNGVSSGTTYTVTGTDANGCTATATITSTDSCDYVWPGDANDDAVADNVDILDIGIANGATGTTRANASLTWVGQPSAPWGQTLMSGTDYKWVDCDGNGSINPVDTQAVVLNYGMTHTNRYVAPTYTQSAPALGISFDQDSLAAGSTGTLTLSLGNATDQANTVYGIAFRLNYDAAQLSTVSFGMTGGVNWFGTPGNDQMRVVLHPSPANGYVDVAITRLDQQDVSGYGTLGQIYFTATTALAGSGNAQVVPMNITNVVLVNSTGAQQPVNVDDDSIVVADSAIILSLSNSALQNISMYPNPAQDHVVVKLGSDYASQNTLVTLRDREGRIVASVCSNGNPSVEINTANLAAGTYSISVDCSGCPAVTAPLIITR